MVFLSEIVHIKAWCVPNTPCEPKKDTECMVVVAVEADDRKHVSEHEEYEMTWNKE